MKKIPCFDLKRENLKYADKLKEAACRVIDSGWFILGEEKNDFEQRFASYCGVEYCVGTGNGLDSIRLILEGYKLLGKLQEGDEVIIPTNTFIATALAVSAARLEPVFADIDADTFNISPQSVESLITKKTKAVVAVHLYGCVAAIGELNRICKTYDILLIEDAAQAHGAELNGKKAGSLSHAAAFSFYPIKNLGALGDAGAITTNDKELRDCIAKLSNYGEETKYTHIHKGLNSRLDEIQAALLAVKLNYLDEENSLRKDIARNYIDNIKHKAIILPSFPAAERQHVFHQFVIRSDNRESLQKHLAKNGITTQVHYPTPIHKQAAYQEYNNMNLPVSEEIQSEILSIPIYPSLTQDETTKIVYTINTWKNR